MVHEEDGNVLVAEGDGGVQRRPEVTRILEQALRDIAADRLEVARDHGVV